MAKSFSHYFEKLQETLRNAARAKEEGRTEDYALYCQSAEGLKALCLGAWFREKGPDEKAPAILQEGYAQSTSEEGRTQSTSEEGRTQSTSEEKEAVCCATEADQERAAIRDAVTQLGQEIHAEDGIQRAAEKIYAEVTTLRKLTRVVKWLAYHVTANARHKRIAEAQSALAREFEQADAQIQESFKAGERELSENRQREFKELEEKYTRLRQEFIQRRQSAYKAATLGLHEKLEALNRSEQEIAEEQEKLCRAWEDNFSELRPEDF